MTDYIERGFEVALGASEPFGVMLAKMNKPSKVTTKTAAAAAAPSNEMSEPAKQENDILDKSASYDAIEEVREDHTGTFAGEEERDDAEVVAEEQEVEAKGDFANTVHIMHSLSSKPSTMEEVEKELVHPDGMTMTTARLSQSQSEEEQQGAGQEAMWMEDEVSTVASVFVKPATIAAAMHHQKKKNRFGFRSTSKKNVVQPHKVHVRRKKTNKTVVLLGSQQQQQKNEESSVKRVVVDANIHEEAAVNMIKARQLLTKAIHSSESSSSSDHLAKTAFEHAVTARRLMSKNYHHPDSENLSIQELETTLTDLTEQGEAAVAKSKRKAGGAVIADFANKAFNILEAIFPSNIDEGILASKSSAEDSISTLGLQTDTFEYQMLPAPSKAPSSSYHNMDLMSISSLNEILDGPGLEEAIERPLSPRYMLSEIHVPTNKTPRTGTAILESRSSSIDSGTSVVRAPSRNHFVSKDKKPKKKWGLLKKFRRSSKLEELPCLSETTEAQSMPSIVESRSEEVESLEEEEQPKTTVALMKQLKPVEKPKITAKRDPVEQREMLLQELQVIPAKSYASYTSSSSGRRVANKGPRYSIAVETKACIDDDEEASSSSSSVSSSSTTSDDSEYSEGVTTTSHRLESVRSEQPQTPAVELKKNQIMLDTPKEASPVITPAAAPKPIRQIHGLKTTSLQQQLIQELAARQQARREQTTSAVVVPTTRKVIVEPENEKSVDTDMHRKSIAKFSEEDDSSAQSIMRPSGSSERPTPTSSKWEASVGTRGTRVTTTKDIRSLLGNTGITTVDGSVIPSVSETASRSSRSSRSSTRGSRSSDSSKRSKYDSKTSKYEVPIVTEEDNKSICYVKSDPEGSKEEATVAPTIAPRSSQTNRYATPSSYMSARSGSQQSRAVSKPSVSESWGHDDESTLGGKDSLINFVISPRRANIVTPGGTKPYVSSHRVDEAPQLIAPRLHVIDEDALHQEVPINEESKIQQAKPKRRFSALFGMRKAKEEEPLPVTSTFQLDQPHLETVTEAHHTSQPTYSEDEDDEESEATVSVSIPPSTISKFHAKYAAKPKATKSKVETVQGKKDEESDTVVLRKVMSEAMNKAEEANLEVMTAPFPHKKKYRHRNQLPGNTRPVPNDLVEAIRMQSGRERAQRARTTPREYIGDAPGISLSIDTDAYSKSDEVSNRCDPSDEAEADVRVLAPTPREKPIEDSENTENKEAPVHNDSNGETPSVEEVESVPEVKYDQRKVTERLYGPIESVDSFIGVHTKVEVNKGVYIGDLVGSKADPAISENDKVFVTDGDEGDVEDKENENVALAMPSPKVAAAVPKRARRSLFGLRRNVPAEM